MDEIRRAWQCPRARCGDWAVFSTAQEIADGAPAWRCGRGHHGNSLPRPDVPRPPQGAGRQARRRDAAQAHRSSGPVSPGAVSYSYHRSETGWRDLLNLFAMLVAVASGILAALGRDRHAPISPHHRAPDLSHTPD